MGVVMAFKSDAHCRWWFANRDAGGGISDSAGERQIDAISKQVSDMDAWQERQNQQDREAIIKQVAEMDAWHAECNKVFSPEITSQEQQNQQDREAIIKQVAENDAWDDQNNYFKKL